ncbi:hypothetical protein DFR70_1332 [Nocardia tenerifensis]|uniref:Uncharacterized protein n=1 Tax=Nocardia tenerifensis TaxID=228006 RepID=A0A318K045_9NOCA|nr:hypothetical protein [Nocardia tenerifensis]PXX52270.1 hypothetical protein DFR70_1332 [Nocardia tenerifensis]
MSTENPTPDMDLDDPFIARYATKVPDEREVLMRADFARMHDVLANMDKLEVGDEFDRLVGQADEIDLRWLDADTADERAAWAYLSDAHDDWKSAPATMARFHDQIGHDRAGGWDPLTPMEWRSQLQARELTGHGAWTAERDTGQVRAPLPGHAFAGLVTGRDSEREVER